MSAATMHAILTDPWVLSGVAVMVVLGGFMLWAKFRK
jgi:hypothetical protein